MVSDLDFNLDKKMNDLAKLTSIMYLGLYVNISSTGNRLRIGNGILGLLIPMCVPVSTIHVVL